MKSINRCTGALLGCLLIAISLGSCKSTKPTAVGALEQELEEKNRNNVSLLQRIRQLPGVSLRNGVPVILSTANSIDSDVSIEPLYILDDYIVGQSFRALNELVDGNFVKSVRKLSSSEASFYGSRAGNGVIKITTY